MKKYSVILLILLFTINVFSKERVTIPRNNTHLREGPGCFYPVIKVLSKGSKIYKLDQSDKWLQVKWQHNVGWVSRNVFENCKSENLLDQKIKTDTSRISQASMSGAVRGFAEKYIAQTGGNPGFVEQYNKKLITPEEYLSFKNNTFQNRNPKKLEKRYGLPQESNITQITWQDEKIGLAVASRIAQKGVIKDSNKVKYINFVGTLVLEKSSGYQHSVKFYIVKEPNSAAYCTPGGIFFLSQGLIDKINNEAELACLLGHELAHFIRKHGQLELQNRETRIKASHAFQKLEEETSSKNTSKLENLANNLYEAACKKRQLKYEYEADRLGVIYAYRAGYNPNTYVNLLKRLSDNSEIDYENFESEWESFYLDKRIKKVKAFISNQIERKEALDVKNKERFIDFMHP